MATERPPRPYWQIPVSVGPFGCREHPGVVVDTEAAYQEHFCRGSGCHPVRLGAPR